MERTSFFLICFILYCIFPSAIAFTGEGSPNGAGSYLGQYCRNCNPQKLYDVVGTGSTFVQPIVNEWVFSYTFPRPEVQFIYSGTGSGQGIGAQITDNYCQPGKACLVQNLTDYSCSDVAPNTNQYKSASQFGRQLQLYPWIGGGIVAIVNLCKLQNNQLILNSTTLANIFLGRITMWNDPAIQADNPQLDFSKTCFNTPIIRVLRSEGSGTTQVFSTSLQRSLGSGWPSNVIPGQTWSSVITTNCTAAKTCLLVEGTFAIVGTVLTTNGGIGYASTGYAIEGQASQVQIRNDNGVLADPIAGCSIALDNATFLADNTADVINHNVIKDNYPPCTFSYFLINTNNTYSTIDRCRKMAEIVKFVNYVLKDPSPRDRAVVGGFVPVGQNVIDLIDTSFANLTCNSEPLPLDFQIPIPAWVPAVILTCAAIGLLTVLIIAPIMFLYRRNPHFIYGDMDFLVLMLFGAMLVFIGLILFGAFPSNGGQEGPLCMGTAWLVIIGGAILYLSLILKVLRIYYTVVPSKKLQKTRFGLTFGVMFSFLCLTLIPVIIVLAVWNGVEPVTTKHTSLDSNDQYYIVCYLQTFWWPIGFVIAGGVLMLFGAYVATKTRSLAPGFNESAPLALSIYNAIVIGGVIVLLLFILDNIPVTTVIFGVGVFFIAIIPLVLIYPPKIYRAMRGTAFKLSKQIKGRCGRCFADCPHCTTSAKQGSQGTVARSSARTSVSRSAGDEA